jgi:AmmeMemoRadiSam system protein B
MSHSRSIREPACIGCYPGNPDELRRYLDALFRHPRGSGPPGDGAPDGSLVAALVPHIDYGRGGLAYTWAFREVLEHSNASLFVIVGTSHYSYERFTLTRQDFRTPLGIVPTDQAYITRLEALYGPGLFDDPDAHAPEHSIELEVIFLQFLFAGRWPIRIVPLLVGSFADSVWNRKQPGQIDDIGRMIASLRTLHRERREPICYLISGDLAHLGPKFKDRLPVSAEQAERSRNQDLLLLQQAEKVDVKGYFEVIEQEQDRRRICGFPPSCTVLEAVAPSRGRLLDYGQWTAPDGSESVSFASMAFHE